MTFANDDAAILMATYQGERYINEQLISFEKQSYKNWKLIVSDDGSTDNTLSIIDEFATRNVSKVTVVAGPQKDLSAIFIIIAKRRY
jgi:glycosyltransferase involved in cell wall biosynthesis